MKKILLALLLAVGFLVSPVSPVSPASAAPIPTGYTDCNQAAWYGNIFIGSRICVDETTGYGPIIYIYSDSGYVGAASVTFWNGISPCNSFIAGAEWNYYNSTSTLISDTSSRCGFSSILTTDTTVGQAGNTVRMSISMHNQIEFYANAAGYEFVWAD